MGKGVGFFFLTVFSGLIFTSGARADSAVDSVANTVNVALRANSVFGALDADIQARTLTAISASLKSGVVGSSWAGQGSWAGALAWLKYDTTPYNVAIPVVQGGTTTVNFGYSLYGPPMSRGNVLAASTVNTRTAKTGFPDVLTGDLNVNSVHYGCLTPSGNERVYGMNALEVANKCISVAKGYLGDVSGNGCTASAEGYTCHRTSSTGESLSFSSQLVEGGNSVSCPAGRSFVATNDMVDPGMGSCATGDSTVVTGIGKQQHIDTALASMSVDEQALPLSDELLAYLARVAWEHAAKQPGYEGAPYPAGGAVTGSDVANGLKRTGSRAPAYSDFSTTKPVNDPSWTVPNSTGSIGGGGGDGVETGSVGFDSWIETLKVWAADLVFALLALAALLVSVSVAIRGAKLVIKSVRESSQNL